MNRVGSAIRVLWRKLKLQADGGGRVARRIRDWVRVPVLRVKRWLPMTDLSSLALWIMYHPECGVLPCDGWQLCRPIEFTQAEIDALRVRLAIDRDAVERRLRIENIVLPSVSNVGELSPRRIAVHVHCYYSEVMPRIRRALENVPVPFDLFVSSPAEGSACPNRGRDIAPMICRYGKTLLGYDYIAHFHTKKSFHAQEEGDWLGHILSSLLGSPNRVAQIFALLEKGYGMVCASDFLQMKEDPTGWQHDLPAAEALLRRIGLSINLRRDYTPIPFPQGSMFWARVDFIRRLLTLPLTFEDFPEEPIGVDGTLAHAIERLLFVLGSESGLKIARIDGGDV